MKKIKLIQSIVFILVILFTSLSSVVAVPSVGVCVNAVVTEISPSQIDKNEEFVVGINIENCGQDTPEKVSFEITNLPEDITVVENLKTEITKFSYSTSERYITYHMRASNDASAGTHTIDMKLNYDGSSKTYKVNINLKGEKADLQIESISTLPKQVYIGEVVELDLGIKNYGNGIAKNVNVKLDYDLIGINEVSLGSFDMDESNVALFKFKVSKLGLIEVPVIISYEDDFGMQNVNSVIKLTSFNKKTTLNIASMKTTPMLPMVGDSVELVMRIENFGEAEINSIKINVEHPFEGNKETFIGTLKAGEDGPSILSFMVDEAGEYEVPVTITYRDDFGVESISETLKISVVNVDESSNSTYVIVFLLLVICVLIYYNFKIKNAKDKIIKQLMKGKNNNK
jgi:hypothetical protein